MHIYNLKLGTDHTGIKADQQKTGSMNAKTSQYKISKMKPKEEVKCKVEKGKNIGNICAIMKSHMCVIAILEGQESENFKETIFQKIRAENCPKLKKGTFKNAYHPKQYKYREKCIYTHYNKTPENQG